MAVVIVKKMEIFKEGIMTKDNWIIFIAGIIIGIMIGLNFKGVI